MCGAQGERSASFPANDSCDGDEEAGESWVSFFEVENALGLGGEEELKEEEES